MISIRLPDNIDKRLTSLAKATGRTKTFYAREAILEYIEEFEDYFLAAETLDEGNKSYTPKELDKILKDGTLED